MTNLTFVRVTWTDCQGDADTWTPISQLDTQACVCVTVGILVEPPPRPDHVTVALSMFDHDDPERETQVGDVVHIPRPMIHTVDNLTVVLTYPES